MNRNPAIRRALGAVLRDFRAATGWSQEALGLAAGVDRTYVGGVERGERNVSFESLWLLLHAMGVSWRALGEQLDRASAFGRAPTPPRSRHRLPRELAPAPVPPPTGRRSPGRTAPAGVSGRGGRAPHRSSTEAQSRSTAATGTRKRGGRLAVRPRGKQ